MLIAKRLTAILVAVVFVLGMMYMPAEIFAVETDAADDAVVTDTAGTSDEAVSSDSSIGAAETEAEVPEEAATEEKAAEEEAITDEEAAVNGSSIDELSDAITVELDHLDGNEYDGFIYKLADDVTKKEVKEMESAIDELDESEGQEVEEDIKKELYKADSIETIAEVADPEMIEYIEPNYIVRAMGSNDPLYENNKWQLESTNIPYVWDKGMTGSGAVVAVLDSGVNVWHEDLAGVTFVKPYNYLTKTTNVTDDFGHGTAVTGVIAETRNNGRGFTGAMSGASIMPIKVLDSDGNGSLFNVVNGINYAVSNRADVINMSLGTTTHSIALEQACQAAANQGVILVAASGNDAQKTINGVKNPVEYPAAYDCVVSVGSVDKNEQWSTFSTHNNKVLVVAPGEDVLLINGSNGYFSNDGTSFATPQVSALAAMMKSRNHSVMPATFINLLKSTAKDLGDPGRDDKYGYGLINYRAIFDYMATQLSYYSMGLSGYTYVYDGKVKTPAPVLSLGSVGLAKGTNYSATYASGRVSVGTYQVTVKGINGISGSKAVSFKIIPPLVKGIKAPKRGKGKLTVRWNAMSKNQKTKTYKNVITGYQVRVSTSSNFANAKYASVKGITKTSKIVKGLKRKTTYYVQYRSYKTVGSTTYYSKWSGTKKAKTK